MSSSGPSKDEAAAREERKAARRAARKAKDEHEAEKAEHAEDAKHEAVDVPAKTPKKNKGTSEQADVAAEPVAEPSASGATSKSKSKKKKAKSAESDGEPKKQPQDEDEFVRQVRTSLDVSRPEYYPHDARKSFELPPTSGDLRPSIEYRKSLDNPPIKVSVDGESADSKKSKSEKTSIDEPQPKKSVEHEITHAAEGDDVLATFPISEGLSTEKAEELLAQYGRNELPEKVTPKWLIFLRLLYQPMPIMIWIAAIVEGAVGDWIDTIVLIAINLGNATLGFYETTKAGDAVAALKASLKPTATCMRDGAWNNTFDARLLVPGDLIELGSGGAVPADCMLNTGTIDVDESAMTGESLPVTLHEREMAKMGGTVVRGETHATVVYTGKMTFFGKTAAMLGNSSEGMSNLQILLLRIITILCVLAFLLCGTCLIYLGVKYKNAKEAISFAVIVLVASIPMAVEIVTTSTLAIGSRVMSQYGAIVSRLAAIEDLAGLNMLCSDKTGTLTKNKMTIQEDAPAYVKGLTQIDLLKQAALAAKWESPPKDALDTLFLRCHLWCPEIKELMAKKEEENKDISAADKEAYYNQVINNRLQEAMSDYESLAFMPFDPRVKRTESTIREKSTGRIYKVTKGAPHILQALDKDDAKNEKIHKKVEALGEDGIRAVAVAVSEDLNGVWKVGAEEQDPNMPVVWHVTGLLTFLDPPRDDTKDTIARSQHYGVPVRMITGDHLLIAKKTAKDLHMGITTRPGWPNIEGPNELPMLDADGKPPANLVRDYGAHIKEADGFAQVFPEHKFLIVETYRQLGYKCGMTGDGVNDAPALKRADVGIAVAGATDAAKAAADIVLTREGLSTIVLGLETSRVIFARMKSFLTYRIAATLQLLFFFFIAVFAFEPSNYVKGGLPNWPGLNITNTTVPAAPSATPTTPVSPPIQYAPYDPTTFPLHPVIQDSQNWPKFFSLPVIYLIIITVINDGTLISIGYDHAVPSAFPERWVLPALFLVSGTLASIACFSSLLWLYWALDSWNPSGVFAKWGIGGINHYGHIVNMMFLKVAVSDILTLFSSRTSHQFFFMRRPHHVLAVAALIALGLTTTLSLVWPCSYLDTTEVCGLAYEDGKLLALWVWIYCIIVFIIQDACKVAVWAVIRHFNWWNVNNEVDQSMLGETGDENHVEMDTKPAKAKAAAAAAAPTSKESPAAANKKQESSEESSELFEDKKKPVKKQESSEEESSSEEPAPKKAAPKKAAKKEESSEEESSQEESSSEEPAPKKTGKKPTKKQESSEEESS